MREKESYGTGRPPLADAVLDLIVAARRRFISMALHWMRVGYVETRVVVILAWRLKFDVCAGPEQL